MLYTKKKNKLANAHAIFVNFLWFYQIKQVLNGLTKIKKLYKILQETKNVQIVENEVVLDKKVTS